MGIAASTPATGLRSDDLVVGRIHADRSRGPESDGERPGYIHLPRTPLRPPTAYSIVGKGHLHMRPTSRIQRRSRFSRVNQPIGSLLVNTYDGFPIDQPIHWLGSDQYGDLPWGENGLGPGAALSAVARAESLICTTLAHLPWRQLTGGPTANTSSMELPPARWVTDPTLLRPDARFYGGSTTVAALRRPASTFWASWIRSALMKGIGYLVFVPAEDGSPTPGTMRILNPDHVQPQVSPTLGIVNRKIGTADVFVETDSEGNFSIGGIRYRLVELPSPICEPDEFGVPMGVLERHAKELGLASRAVNYAASTFRAGIPAGYLKVNKPNFNAPQAEALKQRWLEAHGGDATSIAVLNADIDFTPLQYSPLDMALIESRRMSLVDIANAFGEPVFLLNGSSGDSNSYSNTETRSIDFKTWTLGSWAVAVEEVLSALLPQQQFIQVDFRGLMKADSKTRYEAYAIAIRSGWLTIPEIRSLENLPELALTSDTPDPLPPLPPVQEGEPA